jgi:hypothetical protein
MDVADKPVAVVAALDQHRRQINEIERPFEPRDRIGIRRRSLDRATRRRQIVGKGGYTLVVDGIGTRLSRSLAAAAEPTPSRAATVIRKVRAKAASCSAASSSKAARRLAPSSAKAAAVRDFDFRIGCQTDS